MSRHSYLTVFWLLLSPIVAIPSWAATFQVPTAIAEQSQSFDQYTEWFESLSIYVPGKTDRVGTKILQDVTVSGLLHYQVFDHAQEASIPYLNQLITAELGAVGFSLRYQCEDGACGDRAFWQQKFAPLSADGSDQQSYLVFSPGQASGTQAAKDIVQIYINAIGCCARSTWQVVTTDFPVFDSPVFDLSGGDQDSTESVPTASVLFDTGSSLISVQGQTDLAALGLMIKDSKVRYWIDGHTDAAGSNGANQVLSQQRAEAVLALLLSTGAKPEQFRVRAFGSNSPRANNHTAPGRQSNRRVELIEQP